MDKNIPSSSDTFSINSGIIRASKKLAKKRYRGKLNVVLSESYKSILELARAHRRWAYEVNVTNSFRTIEANIGKQLKKKEDTNPDIIVINLTPEFMQKNAGYMHLCFESILQFLTGQFNWKHINTTYKWKIKTENLSVWVITPNWPTHSDKYRLFELSDGKFVRAKADRTLREYKETLKQIDLQRTSPLKFLTE